MADDDKPSILAKSSEISYGNVIITLDNVLIPDAKLSQTPSANDGLETETEMDLRILGCEFIQMAGILLKLPQVKFKKPFTMPVVHVALCKTTCKSTFQFSACITI